MRAILRKTLYLAAIFGIWILLLTINVGQEYLSRGRFIETQVNFWHLFMKNLQSYLSWAILTPFILWLAKVLPIERDNWFLRLPIHALLGVLFAALHEVIEIGSLAFLHGRQIFNEIYQYAIQIMLTGSYFGIIIYFAVLGVGLAINYHGRMRAEQLRSLQLSKSLAQSQLQALRSRLQPHFLFNTLNTISLLAKQGDKKETMEVIDRLGKLLRLSMQLEQEQLISLRTELEIIDCYLDIQRVRFKDRLRIEKNIDPQALRASVPNMILQPLVENAVKHGFAKSIESGRIEIDIRKNEKYLLIDVRDDGPGIAEGWNPATDCGYGLANTLERLSILYAEDYIFELANRSSKGASARIKIPFTEAEPEPEAE